MYHVRVLLVAGLAGVTGHLAQESLAAPTGPGMHAASSLLLLGSTGSSYHFGMSQQDPRARGPGSGIGSIDSHIGMTE